MSPGGDVRLTAGQRQATHRGRWVRGPQLAVAVAVDPVEPLRHRRVARGIGVVAVGAPGDGGEAVAVEVDEQAAEAGQAGREPSAAVGAPARRHEGGE